MESIVAVSVHIWQLLFFALFFMQPFKHMFLFFSRKMSQWEAVFIKQFRSNLLQLSYVNRSK